MIVQIKWIILLLWITCLSSHTVFSQPLSTKDNYTGAWETPTSWTPTWAIPQTNVSGHDISINGYITVNGSLSFKGTANKLIINDTLVIKGDLTLNNNNDITIMDNGIIIVMGNFTINNQTTVIVNGYMVVAGNLTKNSSQGSLISNDNPVKIFIGGTISPAGLSNNNADYPALNCKATTTTRYPNSTCSYGNMTDMYNDPINVFFQNTCSTSNVNRNCSVCTASTINLTSSNGTAYSWSGPNGFISSEKNPSIPNANTSMAGVYKIIVTVSAGCTDTDTINVIVNSLPATPTITASGPVTLCAGGSVTLTSSAGTNYLWSTGASIASINVANNGSYTVKVTDLNGCQSAASVPSIVTVNALPLTPTITAAGPTTFCEGGSVTLTSSPGTNYLWSNAATTQDIKVSTAGSYTVKLKDASGCQSMASAATVITVNKNPIAYAGPDQELTFVSEARMNAELSPGETGEWSLVSGSGQIADIHSPTSMVSLLKPGENIFLWKVGNGNCEAGSEVKITIKDLFVPSVITPDGDGKNDYFKISENIGRVELIIFNKWGIEEYKNVNYKNDWNGRNKKGTELPFDTYFYVLKFENGMVAKGSVLIKR